MRLASAIDDSTACEICQDECVGVVVVMRFYYFEEMAMSWRRQQLEVAGDWNDWIKMRELQSLARIADDVVRYFSEIVRTREQATRVWQAVLNTRACCSELRIFDDDMVVLAYVLNHFLDRYLRTWVALGRLFDVGVLPMAKNGVSVLDVGAGPGPSVYAVQDFYDSVRLFGQTMNIPSFAAQQVSIEPVEIVATMLAFQSSFSEVAGRPGPFHVPVTDFTSLDTQRARAELRSELESEGVVDENGDFWADYTPSEAHNLSQRMHRYRFVIFSNVLTDAEIFEAFSPRIESVFGENSPGMVGLVMGALGRDFRPRRKAMKEIARNTNMRALRRLEQVIELPQSSPHQTLIKGAQYRIFSHLNQLGGVDSASCSRKSGYPDYWSEVPYARKRLRFSLLALRKERPGVRRRRSQRSDRQLDDK